MKVTSMMSATSAFLQRNESRSTINFSSKTIQSRPISTYLWFDLRPAGHAYVSTKPWTSFKRGCCISTQTVSSLKAYLVSPNRSVVTTWEISRTNIVEFASGGPKNYGYLTNKGKQECKVHGISLNSEGSK